MAFSCLFGGFLKKSVKVEAVKKLLYRLPLKNLASWHPRPLSAALPGEVGKDCTVEDRRCKYIHIYRSMCFTIMAPVRQLISVNVGWLKIQQYFRT